MYTEYEAVYFQWFFITDSGLRDFFKEQAKSGVTLRPISLLEAFFVRKNSSAAGSGNFLLI